jgi:hypothetical protein
LTGLTVRQLIRKFAVSKHIGYNCMTTIIQRAAVTGLCLAWLNLTGCSTPNVNPPAPRAHTGYVDFYTDSDMDLSWEVKRADEGTGGLRTVFSEFKPVQGTILRLAAPPGNHRFQVWFTNLVTEGPQTVQVQVSDGKVTPVHVTLTPVGSTSVERKTYGFRGSAKGYARGTKIVSGQSAVFQIDAIAENPQAYGPKEGMPYWSSVGTRE